MNTLNISERVFRLSRTENLADFEFNTKKGRQTFRSSYDFDVGGLLLIRASYRTGVKYVR